MTQPAPIKQKILNIDGYISRPWKDYFQDITTSTSEASSDVPLNTAHRTSSGVDHTFINQDVTTTSSPSFAGKDILKWAVLQGG